MFGGMKDNPVSSFFGQAFGDGPLGQLFGTSKPKPTAVTAPEPKPLAPESKDTPGRHKSLLGV